MGTTASKIAFWMVLSISAPLVSSNASNQVEEKINRLNPSAQLLFEHKQAIQKTIGTSGERSPEEFEYALNLYEVTEAIDDLFVIHPDEVGGGQVAVVIAADGTVVDCDEYESPRPLTFRFKQDMCVYLSHVNFGLKNDQRGKLLLPIGIHERSAIAPAK